MSTTDKSSTTVRIAAVGDLLLTPDPGGTPYLRSPALISAEVHSLFGQCDVVFGNLECTLPGDGGCVPTEPRVVGTPELVRSVKAAGFNVVTLANNHMFDCLEPGFQNMRRQLDAIGLLHFGAGADLNEAAAPAIVEVNGVRLAFLGAVDTRSGPFQFAGPNQWGVASLDIDRLIGQIRDLRSGADHVVVSVHWGEERLLIPSPVQIDQAHALAEAGASLILGHHPHVVQGLEMRSYVPVIYSLGNFIADDVYFSDGSAMRWNRSERTGCILVAELSARGVETIRQIPTYDSGRLAEINESRFSRRRIERTSRVVARGVTWSRYRREYLWVKTILPSLRHLRWSELKKLRIRHFRNALGTLIQAGKAQ